MGAGVGVGDGETPGIGAGVAVATTRGVGDGTTSGVGVACAIAEAAKAEAVRKGIASLVSSDKQKTPRGAAFTHTNLIECLIRIYRCRKKQQLRAAILSRGTASEVFTTASPSIRSLTL